MNPDGLIIAAIADPFAEDVSIGACCREEDKADMFGSPLDDFFPDLSAFFVGDVVNFVKDNPFDVIEVGIFAENHITEDFCCHDEAWSVFVFFDIAGENTNMVW